MSLRDALDYAADGWAVVPVNSNKRIPISNEVAEERGWIPKGDKGGVYLASTDPDRIREMWAEYPVSGIAAHMGASDLIAIDDDTEKKGETEGPGVEFLKRHHKELWSTRVHTTQGGGRHFIFEAEGRPIKSGPVTATIDVKSKGGYVVLPPSVGYKVLKDTPPQPMSKALRADLRRMQAEYRPAGMNKGTSEATNEELIEAIITGKDFHDATLHLTKNWAVEGMSLEERRERIDEIYRKSALADPAHPDHKRWSDRYKETWRTSDKAEKYREITIDELHEMWGGIEPLPDTSPLKNEVPQPVEKAAAEFLEIDGTELLQTDLPDIDYLINDFLIAGGLHSIAGPSGVGKTRYISLLLACLMTGRTDIMGLPAGRPVRAMYFANEERAEDVQRRIKATMHVNGLTGGVNPLIRGKDAGTTRLLKQEAGVVAKDEDTIDWIIEHVRRAGVELVIFDPFNTLGGEEENSAVAVSEVMDAMRDITAATGAAIMFIHHTPKDRSEAPDALRGDSNAWRGSGAIYSALDMGFTLFPLLPDGIKKEDRQRLRKATAAGLCSKFIVQDTGKVREGETLAPVAYRFVGQEVRPGGKPIGALKVVSSDLAVGEMELAINMSAAVGDNMLIHEWGSVLITEFGEGRTETTIAAIDKAMTEAKAGGWTGKDKATAGRGRGKQILELFAVPQATTGHIVQVLYNPDGPRNARVRIEIEKV